VLDLNIKAGKIEAKVHGSSTYSITVGIKPYPAKRWAALKTRCAGRIDSLIDLLKGELSEHVIEHIIDREQGLFPTPDEIDLRCSCPDWARMCKHVAAAMYGVGHRLDHRPDLLFTLRGLDPADLIAHATHADALGANSATQPTIEADQLADVFGIDLADHDPNPPAPPAQAPPGTRKKAVRKKAKKRTAKKKPPRQSTSKTTSSRQRAKPKPAQGQSKRLKKKKK